MQQDNRRSPARPLSALPITERTQSSPPAVNRNPETKSKVRTNVSNATKCNAVQQDNRRSPARPLSALPITERTQSSPPAVNRNPETKSKVRTNVSNATKCN